MTTLASSELRLMNTLATLSCAFTALFMVAGGRSDDLARPFDSLDSALLTLCFGLGGTLAAGTLLMFRRIGRKRLRPTSRVMAVAPIVIFLAVTAAVGSTG